MFDDKFDNIDFVSENDLNNFMEENVEANRLMGRIEVESVVTEKAKALKQEILSDVHKKIELQNKQNKRKSLFRYISVASAGIAAILIITVFFWFNDRNMNHDLLYALNSTDGLNAGAISIISGDVTRELNEGDFISHTADGNILVNNEQVIAVSDFISVVVPYGKRTIIEFEDKTTAWVNSGTKITYPKKFQKKNREIYMNGEIYIEVSKDAERPFHVNAENLEVEVLGTKFNVNAFSQEAIASVVLIEGSVKVHGDAGEEMLIPGQGYFEKDGTTEVVPVDTYNYTCWKDQEIRLLDEPFDVLLRKISRYYGVEIDSPTTMNSLRFEGVLDLTKPVEENLRILAAMGNFDVEKANNETFFIK